MGGYDFGSNGPFWKGISMLGGFRPDSSGSTFYLDGNNGSTSFNGKSWSRPFKTWAQMVVASNADIGRGSDRWARRNTVYVAADDLVESITAFPEKTDVIGVGSVNGLKHAQIRGTHVPVAGFGCRIFNMNFAPSTAGTMMLLTNACWGTEFHNCTFFYDYGATAAVKAIDTTGTTYLKIIGCTFSGAFSGDVIDIGAGDMDGFEFRNNMILGGANDGIVFTGDGTLSGGKYGIIDNNIIKCVTETINDGTNTSCLITNNKCITAAAHDDAESITATMAANNVVVDGSGVAYTIPRLLGDDT